MPPIQRPTNENFVNEVQYMTDIGVAFVFVNSAAVFGCKGHGEFPFAFDYGIGSTVLAYKLGASFNDSSLSLPDIINLRDINAFDFGLVVCRATYV